MSILNKKYYVEKSRKMLEEMRLLKAALKRYEDLAQGAPQGSAGASQIEKQLKYIRKTVDSIENSLRFLDATEYRIIDMMYISDHKSAEDLCEDLGLERSSIYRHRRSALGKITLALFGSEEMIG